MIETGWVYVITNESMPGFVKVGVTSKRPETRAKKLDETGSPMPYKVETAFLFSEAAERIEKRAHALLADVIVRENREWFRCLPQVAAEKVLDAAEILSVAVLTTDPVLLTKDDILKAKRKEEQKRVIQAQRKEAQKIREEKKRAAQAKDDILKAKRKEEQKRVIQAQRKEAQKIREEKKRAAQAKDDILKAKREEEQKRVIQAQLEEAQRVRRVREEYPKFENPIFDGPGGGCLIIILWIGGTGLILYLIEKITGWNTF